MLNRRWLVLWLIGSDDGMPTVATPFGGGVVRGMVFVPGQRMGGAFVPGVRRATVHVPGQKMGTVIG